MCGLLGAYGQRCLELSKARLGLLVFSPLFGVNVRRLAEFRSFSFDISGRQRSRAPGRDHAFRDEKVFSFSKQIILLKHDG